VPTTRSVILCNGDMQTFSTDTNWTLYWNGPGSQWQFLRTNNVGSGATAVLAATPAVLTWYFVEGWWNGSTQCKVCVNRGTPALGAASSTNLALSKPLTLGANGLGGNLFAGRIDAAFYANVNPEGVAGLQDRIYNGGAGVRWSQLAAADQAWFTGGGDWYELGELTAETTSCDFARTNHLTRNGGPAQADGKT
jgi:Concanavalin A-like lectin/glucanases superfamily